MAKKSLDELIERWRNDPNFREEMRSDPEGAVRRSGHELSEDEWATLRSMDWNNADSELDSRPLGVLNPEYGTTH